MFLFQAALTEDNSQTESPGVKKPTKSADESSKKRKHSDEVPTKMAPVPPPQVVPEVLSIVTPGLMLVPKGKPKISPSTPIPQFQGITFTKLPLEEPDHPEEGEVRGSLPRVSTTQVKLLGSFSGFSLTSSFFRRPIPSLRKGR